jgi:hypothetical protein
MNESDAPHRRKIETGYFMASRRDDRHVMSAA